MIGQAGVGKSRLLRELADRASDQPRAPRRAPRPLPRLRLRARVLGARRDRPRAVRDRRHRRLASSPGASSSRGVEELLDRATTSEPAERVAAALARPLGIEPPDELEPATARTPSRSASASSRPSAPWSRPPSRAAAAGPRVRGHPLGRRGNARPDRVPRPLGARPGRCIVCLARDELLERRPGWGGGRRNATTISLEPLAGDEAQGPRRRAPRRRRVPQRQPRRLVAEIAERSGGNPLFAEEMVNRLAEEGVDGAGGAPRHGPRRARRAARLRSSRRSAARPARRRGRPDLLGGLARRASRPTRASTCTPARRAPGEGLIVAPPAAGSPASASSPSSTC